MAGEPPFEPPYRTFEQMPEGLRVIETLIDGTTRIVPANEAAQLAGKWEPSTLRPTARKAAPGSNSVGSKPSAQVTTQGNDRAALFLSVPFAEKDEAKRLGARWDGAMHKWYAPHGVNVNLFARWWPDALKRGAKTFGQLELIACGVRFDNGRMFDLLRAAKAHPATRSVPFYLIFGHGRGYSQPILVGIRGAAMLLGAVGLTDLAQLEKEIGKERAYERLRAVLRHALHAL